MTPEIIAFTYDTSVFGRKLDWYLTLRDIKYKRCIQLNRLPRPDLEALGIKYRRIPIMAIGRDIYCDSRLIFAKLETLFPDKTLGSTDPFEQGVEYLLENWVIDGGPFWKTAGLIPPTSEAMNDPKWLEDRKEMTNGGFTKENLRNARPETLAHCRMYFDMVENRLMKDGRQYILDTQSPTLADIHGIWTFDWALQPLMNMWEYLEKDVISEELYPKTFAWVHRFRKAIEEVRKQNGKAETVAGEDAVEMILGSEYSEDEGEIDHRDPLKLKKGQMVEIYPVESGMNHHDKGELVALSVNEVVISSAVPGGKGHLRLHFPRINFRIRTL